MDTVETKISTGNPQNRMWISWKRNPLYPNSRKLQENQVLGKLWKNIYPKEKLSYPQFIHILWIILRKLWEVEMECG